MQTSPEMYIMRGSGRKEETKEIRGVQDEQFEFLQKGENVRESATREGREARGGRREA